MRLSLVRTGAAACLIFGLGLAVARAEESAAPKVLTWLYECNPGIQCPTTCTNAGTELFSTSDYVSLAISQMHNQLFWLKIETGQKPIEYVVEAERLQCAIAGARLAYVRYQEPGALVTGPK